MADPVRWPLMLPDAEPALEGRYEPDVIALMVKALDVSWRALAFAHFADEHEMRLTREVLATRILENVAAGERRLSVLSGDALGALEPRTAKAPGGQDGRPSWRDDAHRGDAIEVVRLTQRRLS